MRKLWRQFEEDIITIRSSLPDSILFFLTKCTFEKKNNLPPGTIRNPDGRDMQSEKLIGTIRKEGGKGKK